MNNSTFYTEHAREVEIYTLQFINSVCSQNVQDMVHDNYLV